jgi:membrane protease YdiL (CAAX protease family)
VNSSTSTISPVWPTHWPKDSFRSGPTLLVAGGVIVLTAVLLIIGVAWLAIVNPAATQRGNIPIIPALVIQLVIEAAILVVLLAALPWLSGFSLAQLGFVAPRAWQVGIAAIGAVVMAIVANGGASLIQALTHSKHEQSVVEMFKQIHDPKTIAFFAFFAIVLAPIAEETIFRVFLFNVGLRYGGFWTGAIISGVLFGAAHGDTFALIPLALGGIVLAAVYYRTRNAFASMITHGLFNALTVLALVFAPQLTQ